MLGDIRTYVCTYTDNYNYVVCLNLQPEQILSQKY